MKTAATEQVVVTDLRTSLKELMAKEIKQLPDYLENLPAKEKLNYLLKLMPYVFPKVESVYFKNNEPGEDSMFI